MWGSDHLPEGMRIFMLKNVVFDLGGVVVDYDPRAYLSERFLNQPLEDFLYEHIFASDTWRALDAGTITMSKGVQLMLDACGPRRYEAQMVLDDWRDMLVTKNDTVRLMEQLRTLGYPLYYLSDIAEDVLEMFQQKKRFMQYFTGGIASCEVKITKPDPRIFAKLVEVCKLDPAETIFIDDRQENVDAAAALGFTAILFTSALELRRTLLSLDLPLPAPRRPKSDPASKSQKAGSFFKLGKTSAANKPQR